MTKPVITAAVGCSANSDAKRAAREAAGSALKHLSPQGPMLAIVFASSWFDQTSLMEGIHSVLGNVPIVGETTAGEISPEGPASHSCVVLLMSSNTLAWALGVGERIDQSPREAGQQAAYIAVRTLQKMPRVGLLLFGDGLTNNFADVVRGMQEVVGTSALIVGGLAADDLRFDRTYQYFNRKVLTQSVVGVLFGGSGRMGVGIEHGFAPISKPRLVTRARAHVLMELDNQPATRVYEDYFGVETVHRMQEEGFSRQRIAYPLGIQCEATDQWLLRNVVSFEHDGSLACSGEIIEGSWLQLMIGSRELALEAARKAAQQAIQPLNEVACVLVFDSVARRKLLGESDAAQEVSSIRQIVGAEIPLAGCYTYGEQGPFGLTSVYGRSVVQTGSVLVVAIGT